MIFVIEGADGCGKTTIVTHLANELKAEVISFPNDMGYTGPIIREYLKKGWVLKQTSQGLDEHKTSWSGMDERRKGALAFQALQIVNRLEMMPYLQEREFSKIRNVVVSRYWQSGWVYGGLEGLSDIWIEKTQATMVKPIVNILLDVTAKCAYERRASRDGNKAPELYEGNLSFLEQVISRYRHLWDMNRATVAQTIQWPIIYASGTLEQTLAAVRCAVSAAMRMS